MFSSNQYNTFDQLTSLNYTQLTHLKAMTIPMKSINTRTRTHRCRKVLPIPTAISSPPSASSAPSASPKPSTSTSTSTSTSVSPKLSASSLTSAMESSPPSISQHSQIDPCKISAKIAYDQLPSLVS